MEYYNVSKQQDNLLIEGFPDAVKVIALEGKISKRLADLELHRTDLEFADQCLDAINSSPEEPFVIREALWRSSIIHFIKCFGTSGARFQLSPQKIFKAQPEEALMAFNYFKSLRNKHFIHDENSHSQSLPGAILANASKNYKIEKIVCFSSTIATLSQETYGNLKLLIRDSLLSVNQEFEALSNDISKELEIKPYDSLLSMRDLQYRVPTSDEIHINRVSKSDKNSI